MHIKKKIMEVIYKLVEKKELNICQIVCYKDNKKHIQKIVMIIKIMMQFI